MPGRVTPIPFQAVPDAFMGVDGRARSPAVALPGFLRNAEAMSR